MALVVKDRVKETTTTTGTGSISLGGAVTKFKTFSSALSNADTTYYAIEQEGDTNEFEVGIGTYASSGNTLARTTILSSSNSNNAVDFSAGTKNIFITYPADKAVYEDASGNISASGTVDGVDILSRDAVLTSTTTTANAAMPKTGGTFSGDVKIGFDPDPDFDIDDSGAVGSVDALDYTAIAQGGDNNEFDSLLGIEAPWTDTTIKHHYKVIKGSSTGALREAVGVSGTDFGDLVVFGNVHSDGTNQNITTGMTIDGGNLRLIAQGEADHSATGNASMTIDAADIVVTGTVDGVDIADRDAVLTSTTTTANAAMPTTGGTFTGDISFEGATANDYETTVTVTDPTADRTITLPDATGTVLLADGDGSNLTNVQAASVDIDESTDDDVNYNILFSDTSGSGSIQMTPQQDDEGVTFNPSNNKLVNGGVIQAGPRSDDHFIFQGYGADTTSEYVAMGVQTGYASITAGGVGSTSTDLRLRTANSGTEADKVTIKADGKTGIGTTSPSEALDVVGNIAVSGTVDGVDIAARDAVLTSTTTTANSAMPLSGGTFTGDVTFADNEYAIFGASDDIKIGHNGNGLVNNYTNDLYIQNYANDRDVIITSDNGSGGTLIYFKADGSTGEAQLYHYGYEKLATKSTGISVTGDISFEGATANDYETTVTVADPTADRTITLPNQTGTAMLWQTLWPDDPNSTGWNTVLGGSAGNSLDATAEKNTLIGQNAGLSIVSQDYNTVVGQYAYADDGTASSGHNTAVGYYALTYNSWSSAAGMQYNTSVGSYSGSTNKTGDNNTFVGYNARNYYSNSSNSVIVGNEARAGHSGNVTIGSTAARDMVNQCDRNTIVGYAAAQDLNGSDDNVYIGDRSGYRTTTGYSNTMVGGLTGFYNTLGSKNTYIGERAGNAGYNGDGNTCVGRYSGYNVEGDDNTVLGNYAGASTNMDTNANCLILGANANPSTSSVSNEITLGDANISSLRCNVQTISSLSDERDKTDIADLTYGLDFLNDMRPVEFTWNRRDGSLGAKTDMGFIAQELWETELDHSSSSRTRLVNWENPQKLEADYVRSYPILVKAVQELSAQVKALEARIETLEGN